MGLVSFIILILDIAVGMYMQKYILLLSIAQSQPAHTHLQHVIRLTVSASKELFGCDCAIDTSEIYFSLDYVNCTARCVCWEYKTDI